MPKENQQVPIPIDQQGLLDEIEALKHTLEGIEGKIREFEGKLRAYLGDLIVEEQELFILYKEIKKAKKAKRLEQKKRGKNYQEPIGLQPILQPSKSMVLSEDEKEKKRLYREALLHVHPDKFSMSESVSEIATTITTRLIEIYKSENLASLQAFHAHIFSGNANISLTEKASNVVTTGDHYLAQEKQRILAEIASAREHHLYKVLTEYQNPLSFVDELKEYYMDRISKLMKRTRKGL